MKSRKRKSITRSVPGARAGKILLVAAAFALVGATTVNAQQFGGWVTIGQPGNADSGYGYGGVDYAYNIAKYQVSIADWNTFWEQEVDAVDGTAVGDFAGNGGGVDDFNVNLDIEGDDGWKSYAGTDAPVGNVSVNNIAQYANWLTTGDATQGAYGIDGSSGAVTGIDRNTAVGNYGTVYVVPTEDEWYKAAYYRLDDSTYYEDSTPAGVTLQSGYNIGDEYWNYEAVGPGDAGQAVGVGDGGLDQNGTRNMMGNHYDMLENGVKRGGNYQHPEERMLASYRFDQGMTYQGRGNGARIVVIPEPASGALFVLVSGLFWFVRRRVRA